MAEHVQAKILRAIADGKAVQFKSKLTGLFNDPYLRTHNPLDMPDHEWRVKPVRNTVSGWLNIYENDFGHVLYKTREQAIDCVVTGSHTLGRYIKTIEISHTWEEDNASGSQ